MNAGENGPLSLMMYTVIEAFMPIANMIVSQVRERRAVADFHGRLAAAIKARDADEAVRTLGLLLGYLRDSYCVSLDRRLAVRPAVHRPSAHPAERNPVGVDSVYAPKTKRERAWKTLANYLDHGKLAAMTTVEPFSKLPELAQDILAGRVHGRVVIAMG